MARIDAGGGRVVNRDIVPPGEQGRLYVGPPPPGPDDLNRWNLDNDRSAYTQQGLRPAGGEPWRGHAGGVDESFFWGGSTGKRAW